MQQDWKEYLALLRQHPGEAGDMLRTVDDPELLTAYSEAHGVRLGIVYKSRWHTLVVDLVRDRAGQLRTYERLLKTVSGSSVVAIPFHGEKLVLLKQFRHALGGYQYCFPRGFAEPGIPPAENARKELREELNCQPAEPTLLGQVVADSGICGEKVWVFRCDISMPRTDGKYENIEGHMEITLPELLQMVRSGQINDGFTLSAIALLQNA